MCYLPQNYNLFELIREYHNVIMASSLMIGTEGFTEAHRIVNGSLE